MASPLDMSMGFFLVGVFIAVWLYGFTCVQTFLYFSMFKQDKKFMKALVFGLFIADTLHTILMMVSIYDYLVTHFGEMAYIAVANRSFSSDPILTAAIALAVQGFFAWRVHRLSRTWYLSVPIAIFGFVSFLAAIGTTVGVEIVKNFAEFQRFQVAVIVWLVGAALADAIITGSLFWTLHKARTGFAQTDDVLTKLIRHTVQTGLLTSMFAIADIITFLASTSTLHLVFNLPLSKLYVNTLLSTLNARVLLTSNPNGASVDGLSSSGARGVRKSTVHGSSHGRGGRFDPTVSTASQGGMAVTRGANSFFSRSAKLTTLNPHLETGVQVTTVEETFEDSTRDVNAMEMLPTLPNSAVTSNSGASSMAAAQARHLSFEGANSNSTGNASLTTHPYAIGGGFSNARYAASGDTTFEKAESTMGDSAAPSVRSSDNA